MLSVLGEALIDLVAGEDGRFTAHPGGSPMNVAVGLARLERPARFLARLSDDAFGRTLRAHVEGNGVDTSSCVHAGEPTTLAVVSIDDDGRAEYDFYVQGTADWQWSDAELSRLPQDTTVFHTGSLASWTEPGATRVWTAVTRMRGRGDVLITYDPNARPRLMGPLPAAVQRVEDGVALAHVVKCSDEDLDYLYPGDPVDRVIDRWLALGPAVVVVTRGSEGAQGGLRTGYRTSRPGLKVEVADTIGAGDAFMAGLLSGLFGRDLASPVAVAGLTPEHLDDVIDDAVLTAALTCERPGADPPTAATFAQARARRRAADIQ